MSTTPLRSVKDHFKGKAELVASIRALASDKLWLDRVNEQKGLGRVSNKKLLRLHRVLTDVKERFGTRDKLIAAILDSEQRSSDAGYRSRLESYPLPRLLDFLASTTRRAKQAGARPAASPRAPRPERPKPAKAATPKKAPAADSEAALAAEAPKNAEAPKKTAAPRKAAPATTETAKAPAVAKGTAAKATAAKATAAKATAAKATAAKSRPSKGAAKAEAPDEETKKPAARRTKAQAKDD